jgi:hypothetical protein
MQEDPGIELAAVGSHRQPVERGEAHCRCDRGTLAQRTGRAAVAEMGDDDAAVGDISCVLRQD